MLPAQLSGDVQLQKQTYLRGPIPGGVGGEVNCELYTLWQLHIFGETTN